MFPGSHQGRAVSVHLRGKPAQVGVQLRRVRGRNGIPQGVGSLPKAERRGRHRQRSGPGRGHRSRHDGHHGRQNVRQTQDPRGGIPDAERVSVTSLARNPLV